MNNREIMNNLEKMLEMENKSESTYWRYSKVIVQMMEYFKGRNLSKLKEEEILSYAYHLHESKISVRTYNGKIAAIRYMYRKVVKREVGEAYLPLKRNEKRSERNIPSEEEIKEIIEKCEDIELLSFIMLGVGSGLRISEIASLKVSDIKKGKNKIVVIGKGKRTRETIVDEITLQVLRRYYVKERKYDNEYLFSRRNNIKGYVKLDEIGRRIKKYMESLGMEYTMHDFRRAFATILYKGEVDLVTIKRYLGHDSIETTMKYINIEKYRIKKEVLPTEQIFSKTSIRGVV